MFALCIRSIAPVYLARIYFFNHSLHFLEALFSPSKKKKNPSVTFTYTAVNLAGIHAELFYARIRIYT